MDRVQEVRLLTAALNTLDEVGYSGLTVAQIVTRAGVSRKTFYDLFDSAEDCFRATVNWGVAQVAPAVVGAYQGHPRWRDGVRAALAVLLRFFDGAPAFAQLLVVETFSAGNRALDTRTQIIESLAEVIDQGSKHRRPHREPLPLAGEAVVGAVWSILYTRLTQQHTRSLLAFHGSLMSVIVLAYLGQGIAHEELSRTAPDTPALPYAHGTNPDDLPDAPNMRLTYRTLRVLSAVGANPGGSNREIGIGAEIVDQGQVSKLLARLQNVGLIHNTGLGQAAGAANAWSLTARGEKLVQGIGAARTTT